MGGGIFRRMREVHASWLNIKEVCEGQGSTRQQRGQRKGKDKFKKTNHLKSSCQGSSVLRRSTSQISKYLFQTDGILLVIP
jgi:hypothetical protein